MPVCFRKKVRCIKYLRPCVPSYLRCSVPLSLSYFCFSETPNPGPRSSKLRLVETSLKRKRKEGGGEKKENCPIGTHVVMDLVDGKNGKRAVFWCLSLSTMGLLPPRRESENRYKDTIRTVRYCTFVARPRCMSLFLTFCKEEGKGNISQMVYG